MSDLFANLLSLPGLWAVIGITCVAGLVYGFAGFGAALIFMPVASAFVPVEMAVAAFAVTALASFVTLVPRAWGQSDKSGVSLMLVIAALALPVGTWILKTADTTTIRWGVLLVAAITLVALISGWRYRAAPTHGTRAAVALATGVVGGATGLVGPIMILFQLSGQDSIERSRANTLIFLTCSGLLTVPALWVQGLLTPEAMALGLILMLPYGLSARIGQALFDPEAQRLYRWVAYAVIAASILMGLPIYH